MSQAGYLASTWFDPRITLKPSTIHGKGLFASELIQANEVVMIWGGTLYTRQDLQDIRAGKLKVEEFSYSFIEEDILIAAPSDGLDYFVNHSCDPNLWMSNDVTVVARRAILPGEEITGDYAVWEAEPNYVLAACQCGSVQCRKQVSGNDWMLPELQTRYQDHFLPYISRRIARFEAQESLNS
jgi:uncharacterized protein